MSLYFILDAVNYSEYSLIEAYIKELQCLEAISGQQLLYMYSVLEYMKVPGKYLWNIFHERASTPNILSKEFIPNESMLRRETEHREVSCMLWWQCKVHAEDGSEPLTTMRCLKYHKAKSKLSRKIPGKSQFIN